MFNMKRSNGSLTCAMKVTDLCFVAVRPDLYLANKRQGIVAVISPLPQQGGIPSIDISVQVFRRHWAHCDEKKTEQSKTNTLDTVHLYSTFGILSVKIVCVCSAMKWG